MSKRIAVDVDGTLTQGERRYWVEDCKPDMDMIQKVNSLYKSGHTVIIWTARPWSNASDLAAWLQDYGVRYHGLRMDKGSADVYIDDKTLRPVEIKEDSNSADVLIDTFDKGDYK